MLNFWGKVIDAGNSYSEASLNQPTTLALITVCVEYNSVYDNEQR